MKKAAKRSVKGRGGAVSPSCRSMTGFGAGRAANKTVQVDVEIKTANSRFLDLTMKLPRLYTPFENELREILGSTVQRGRVDVVVSRSERERSAGAVEFHGELFDAAFEVYLRVLKRSGCDTAEARAGAVRDILTRREVLGISEESGNPDRERELVVAAFRKALAGLVSMREREGVRLAGDLTSRLERLVKLRGSIGARAALAPAAAQERLTARLKKLAPAVQVDPDRLAAEVALIADRLDVTEELVRLDSHFEQFRAALQTPSTGRKLDFLLQELGREFNTIGSKAQDGAVQAEVVEAKTEMERIREQVQNLE